jgi:hypothetical protein
MTSQLMEASLKTRLGPWFRGIISGTQVENQTGKIGRGPAILPGLISYDWLVMWKLLKS